MADWSLPTLTDTYTNFLTYLKSRDVDAATMFVSAPTTPPTGAMKYVRASNKFQEWDGAAWGDKVLAIAGGGTGASTASGARTALGLGSMATQDNSAVNITGGTITGVTIAVTSLSGTIPLANGGTGASLVLGANGQVLQSNGSAIVSALLTNQNIDAAAAIAWSKISKVTSSLADLATRSAAALNSGILPIARLGSSGTASSSTFLRGDDSWAEVSFAPGAWQAVAYLGSWGTLSATFNAARYRLQNDDDTVLVQGVVVNSANAQGSGNPIFTLAVGYRPSKTLIFSVSGAPSELGGTAIQVRINTSGDVYVQSADYTNQYISLDGIVFSIS